MNFSPEQLEKKEATFKSDIWNLGIIFYLMIFGKLPFEDLKNDNPL